MNLVNESFRTMPSRVHGEQYDRAKNADKALKYHHTFLDDCLRALLPNDLVLLGAPTGLGKTDLALSIAASNAQAGRKVHYFALEAEPRELERRTKYALLSHRAFMNRHDDRHKLNYADWLLNRCPEIDREYGPAVDAYIAEKLGSLWTYYRGESFTARDLEMQALDVHEGSDLIVVDHLHYIDSEDENEIRALGRTVKTLRDLALRIGKPVILIAHLRKKEQGSKRLIASIDDFHGSSNIVKICTQAITIERCHVVQASKWFLAPTFMTVLKDRRAGAPPYVALTQFDRRVKAYQPNYTLGRLTKGGQDWEPVPMNEKPDWALHHKELESS